MSFRRKETKQFWQLINNIDWKILSELHEAGISSITGTIIAIFVFVI